MPDHEGATAPAYDESAPEPEGGPGISAAIAAQIDLQIGRVTAAQDRTTAELRALRKEATDSPASVVLPTQFTYSTAAGAGITQAQGTGIGVQIGGPEIGQQWSVRAIVVGGATLTATPGGTAWVFVSPAPPVDLSLINVIDWTKTALPANAFYGEREVFVPPNSNLWVVVTGGTNATLYTVVVHYLQSPLVPIHQEVAV